MLFRKRRKEGDNRRLNQRQGRARGTDWSVSGTGPAGLWLRDRFTRRMGTPLHDVFPRGLEQQAVVRIPNEGSSGPLQCWDSLL